jgi:site-specific recombinase XerD
MLSSLRLRHHVHLLAADCSSLPEFVQWLTVLKDPKTASQYSVQVQRVVAFAGADTDDNLTLASFRTCCTPQRLERWASMLGQDLQLARRTVRNYLTSLLSFLRALHSRDEHPHAEAHWSRCISRVQELRKRQYGTEVRRVLNRLAARAARQYLAIDQLVLVRAQLLSNLCTLTDRIQRTESENGAVSLLTTKHELRCAQQIAICLVMTSVCALRPCELLSLKVSDLRTCLGPAQHDSLRSPSILSVPLEKVKATSSTSQHFIGLNDVAKVALRAQLTVIHRIVHRGQPAPYLFFCNNRESGASKTVSAALQKQIPLVAGLESYNALTAGCLRRSLTSVAFDAEDGSDSKVGDRSSGAFDAIHASMAHTRQTAARHYHLVDGSVQLKGARQVEALLDQAETRLRRKLSLPPLLPRSRESIVQLGQLLDGKESQHVNSATVDHAVASSSASAAASASTSDTADESTSVITIARNEWSWEQTEQLLVTITSIDAYDDVDSAHAQTQVNWRKVARASGLGLSPEAIRNRVRVLLQWGWIGRDEILHVRSETSMRNIVERCHQSWDRKYSFSADRETVSERLRRLRAKSKSVAPHNNMCAEHIERSEEDGLNSQCRATCRKRNRRDNSIAAARRVSRRIDREGLTSDSETEQDE